MQCPHTDTHTHTQTHALCLSHTCIHAHTVWHTPGPEFSWLLSVCPAVGQLAAGALPPASSVLPSAPAPHLAAPAAAAGAAPSPGTDKTHNRWWRWLHQPYRQKRMTMSLILPTVYSKVFTIPTQHMTTDSHWLYRQLMTRSLQSSHSKWKQIATSLSLQTADDKVFIILTQQMTPDNVTGFTDGRWQGLYHPHTANDTRQCQWLYWRQMTRSLSFSQTNTWNKNDCQRSKTSKTVKLLLNCCFIAW